MFILNKIMLNQNNDKIEQAILLIRKTNFAEATNLLKDIINNDRSDFRAYYLLGTLYLQLNNLDLAESNLRNALKLNSKMNEAMHNLGIILSLKKNFIEAKDFFLKAIEIRPENLQSLIELGRTYDLLNKFDEAKKTFEKILRIDSENKVASSLLGSMLLKKGLHSEGLEYLKKSSGLIRFDDKNFKIIK